MDGFLPCEVGFSRDDKKSATCYYCIPCGFHLCQNCARCFCKDVYSSEDILALLLPKKLSYIKPLEKALEQEHYPDELLKIFILETWYGVVDENEVAATSGLGGAGGAGGGSYTIDMPEDQIPAVIEGLEGMEGISKYERRKRELFGRADTDDSNLKIELTKALEAERNGGGGKDVEAGGEGSGGEPTTSAKNALLKLFSKHHGKIRKILDTIGPEDKKKRQSVGLTENNDTPTTVVDGSSRTFSSTKASKVVTPVPPDSPKHGSAKF